VLATIGWKTLALNLMRNVTPLVHFFNSCVRGLHPRVRWIHALWQWGRGNGVGDMG